MIQQGASGRRAPSLKAVELVLTAACNLRCAYCYQRSHLAARMAWETLRAGVDLLAASRHPEVRLGFYGGEPLLERGLLCRGIEHAVDVLPSPRRRLRLHLTTNGTLLDPGLAAFLAARRVELRLSFDGVAAAQERRSASTFARLDALLDGLQRSLPVFLAKQVSVGVTLSGANLYSLADSIDYFLSRRVGTIAISPLLTPDPDWAPKLEAELDRQLDHVRSASLSHYERTGRVPVALFRHTRGPSVHRSVRGHCNGGRGDGLTIDVDGRVTACVMYAASYAALPATPLAARLGGLQLGQVSDPDLGRRLAAYRAAARATGLFVPVSSRPVPCRRCPARHECLICPASVAYIVDNDDPHAIPPLPCAFNRVVARQRALFPAQPSLADVLTGRASPLPLAPG